MAELVGDAYIRITADTRAMEGALARQMKRAGKKDGEEYQHAFSKEVERIAKQDAKRAQSRLAKGIVDPKEFDKMAKEFDKVEDAAKSFNDKLTDLRKNGHIAKGETVEYRKAIKAWETQAIKTREAAKKLNEERAEEIRLSKEQKEQARQLRIVYERDHGEALRMLREQSALRKMVLNRDHSEALKMIAAEQKAVADAAKKRAAEDKKFNDEMQRKLKQDHDWQVAEAYRMNARLDAAMRASEKAAKEWRQKAVDGEKLKWAQRVRVERDALKQGGEIEAGALFDRLRANIKNDEMIAAAAARIGKKSDRDEKLRYSALGRWLGSLNKKTDTFGNAVGKAFGKGKRNDFINLIGGMAGAFAKLGAKLAIFPLHLLGALTDSFSAFFTTLKEGGNILQAGGAGIGAFIQGIGFAVPALIGAVAALVLFGEVIPGVVAGLSLLAGAVVATASAISYGLVGALAAVGPAAAGALLGLGGVFFAIRSFASDKKNKKLMKEWFEDSQKNWAKQFKGQAKSFLSDMHEVLHVLLDAATPAVKAFFASWNANMKDTSTKSNGQYLADSLSRIATTLNAAIPHALSGLVGLFRPIMPYAEALADKIAEIASRFDEWANSEPGQNQIADFMKTAWADAKKVWDILVDIKDLIFTVFEVSEPTGGGILDGIHSKLREIIKWLQDPANRGKIDEWFANAGAMAVDVGELAGHLGEIIKNFNSKEAQANAKNIMDIINAIGAGAAAVSATADAIGSAFGWLQKISDLLSLDPKEGLGGWLHDKIFGVSKKPPKPPVLPKFTPPPPPKFGALPQSTQQAIINYKATVTLDDKLFKEKRAAIDNFVFNEKTIPIKGNEALWQSMKNTAAAYVFTPKQIPIKGNEKEWNATKGTIAAYVFKPKVVPIHVNDSALVSWVANFNAKNLSKTVHIRYAVSGKLPGGGTSQQGGSTSGTAAGGVFMGAQQRLIAEAGPEAVVPLDRALNRVDPSVRSLSAALQSLSGGRGGLGGGPRVQFNEGAIQVNLPTGDPKLAAEAVLDRLVSYIG